MPDNIKVEYVLKHLRIEEMIKYATASKVDKETLDLLSKVNGHIRVCSSCREKVDSCERINDELKKELLQKDFDFNHIDGFIKIKNNICNSNYK